jgi:hypothetical protein
VRAATPILIALSLCLSACATTLQLGSEVSAYSQWVETRRPATYAFERSPSQEARGVHRQQIEDAARGALEAMGFTHTCDVNRADVIVHVGARARVTRTRQSSAAARHKATVPGGPTDFSKYHIDYVTIDRREVALLIRDRASGQVLYGASASNRGRSIADTAILAAMFEATLEDFPNASLHPRQVAIELGR